MQFKQFKMSENSLFAILLRSSWWVSFLVAAGILLVAQVLVPEKYYFYLASLSAPFVVIGCIAAWRQSKVPGAGRVATTIEAVNGMHWREFSALVEQAYQREGFTVTRLAGAADFRLERAGRVTLVACKRWKAASHGLEPLRELDRLRDTEDAQYALYFAVDGLTDKAREFARKHQVRLIEGVDLAALLRLPRRLKSAG